MAVYNLRHRQTPIGEALDLAGAGPVLVETDDHVSHAILPLDEDLIDYLLERNPRLIAECRAIGLEMERGHLHPHDQVRRSLDA